jgi:hypothetical protein
MLILISIFFSTVLACNEHFLQVDNLRLQSEKIEAYTLELVETKKPLKLIKRVDGGMDGQDIEFFEGLPPQAKIYEVQKGEIFRHYSPEAYQLIKSSGKLIAGKRPYILPDAHLRKEYVDLNGIFLTKPDFPPHRLWMGYSENTPFVDINFISATKIIDLGDGVFLVPGPKLYPDWMIKQYQEWLNHPEMNISSDLLENFKRIKAQGGIKPPLELNINIEPD